MGTKINDHLEDDLEETHDINVTPFIDVILVLLIIFMVAAPLATVDVNVDLPKSNAAASQRPDKPIFITLRYDLGLSLNNDPVTSESLTSELERLSSGNRDQRIYIRADRTVDYGDLMGLMNTIRSAGYPKIALVGIEGTSAK